MAQSAETIAQLEVWRRKAAENTITLDEMKQVVRAIREDRKVAAAVSEKSRSNKNQPKAQVKSADDMLDELGGI